jgi:hypothetical protein
MSRTKLWEREPGETRGGAYLGNGGARDKAEREKKVSESEGERAKVRTWTNAQYILHAYGTRASGTFAGGQGARNWVRSTRIADGVVDSIQLLGQATGSSATVGPFCA